jgi:opacity protein-like surface antigen
MKLKIIFIFIFCSFLSLQAQSSRFKIKNNFSLRAGYSMANFTGDEVTTATTLRIRDDQYFSVNPYQENPRKGLTLGLGYHFNLTKQLSIILEANYEEKGCQINFNEYQILGDFFDFNESATFVLNYLAVPAIIRFYPGDIRVFYMEGGFYYSHLLVINETGNVVINNQQITYEHINENMKNEDMGYTVGMGIQIPFNRYNALGIGVRYSRSFMGPAKYHQMDQTEAYGQSLTFGLNFSFRL